MYCINCNKEIKNRNKYCSIKCQKEHEYKEYILKWKKGEIDGNTLHNIFISKECKKHKIFISKKCKASKIFVSKICKKD